MKKLVLAAVAVVISANSFAWTLDKTADLGPFWHPLGTGGTAIYTNSFVFNGSSGDATLSKLGVHALSQSGNMGDDLKFFLMADSGGNSPTGTQLSASTGSIATNSTQLTLLTLNMSSYVMTVGQRYWVAIQGQGTSFDTYQVGGHTQNSVQADNGTFWYSNSNDFNNYDGQGLTPEMAIYVETVPEPASMLVLGAGVAGFLAKRRRKQS